MEVGSGFPEAPVQSLENLEMKKTLVALAALAATSVFAQSSVTISGNVDLGMRTLDENGVVIGRPANATATGALVNRKQSGPIGNGATGWSSSALGLDIKEELGGGVTAGYSVAIDLNSWAATNDTGAGTNQYFQNTRHSFAFLGDSKMGEVRVGYQYTLDDQIQGGIGRVTPTGNIVGRVQNSAFTMNPTQAAQTAAAPYREGYEKIDSGSFTRNNALQYATPVMSGFQGLVQWAQQTNDSTVAAQTPDGRATGAVTAVAGKYSSGPLNLGASYTTVKALATTINNAGSEFETKTTMTDFAANYDFGAAKVFANMFSRKTDVTTGADYDGAVANYNATTQYGAFANGGDLKRTGWDLGASVPFGKATVFASVGNGKNNYSFTRGANQAEVKIKANLIGVTYDFSKRTSLNAYMGSAKATSDDLFATSVELKRTHTGFGLRHQF